MDTTIRKATRAARAATTPEDILAHCHRLRRAGEPTLESFLAYCQSLGDASDSAREALRRAEASAKDAARQAFQEEHGPSAGMVCAACKGEGSIRSFDAWYPCAACKRPDKALAFHPHWASFRPFLETARKSAGLDSLQSDIWDADEAAQRAERATSNASKGARVEYTNPRARAHFTEDKRKAGKVPVGTIGEVFWVGEEREYRSAYGTWSTGRSQKVGIRTDSGEVFFTATKNLGGNALNAFERYLGQDAYTLRLEEEERQTREQFGAEGLVKGLVVQDKRDPSIWGTVFWAKGRRCGFKRNPRDRSEEPTWRNADEIKLRQEKE